MAATEAPEDIKSIAEAVVDDEHKGFPVIWLLPLIAVLVGAWLIYKTVSETGPSITIRFKTAEGIQAEKTKIKYRDVEVGKVDTVTFTDDLAHILVKATLEPGSEKYLTEQTLFWVVRPRIGIGGVSGLGTLLSGAYLAMEASHEGKPNKSFVGLEKPPVVTADTEGTHYRLRAKTLGSLSIGAPVYLRQFDVGEITDYKLAEDHSLVDIDFFVKAPHDQYVHEGTRFWNAGGVSLTLSATGMQFEMESVVSLLTGGIAYETLPEHANTPLAKEGSVFDLYKHHAAILEDAITVTHTFVTRFSGSVRGLTVGAPVEFRGIRFGTVKSIDLGLDPVQKDVSVPIVLIDLEPERLDKFASIDSTGEAQEIEKSIDEDTLGRVAFAIREKGLRARLLTGNLLTGRLYVDLEFFPDAEPANIGQVGEYPEIPTLPNPLEDILSGFNKIIDKLEKAEIEETLSNLNELIVSSNQVVSTFDKSAPALTAELQATLEEAHATLSTLRETVSTDGEIGNEVYNALAEITAAARSIRVMSEYLERHPEALISGKGGNP